MALVLFLIIIHRVKKSDKSTVFGKPGKLEKLSPVHLPIRG